MAFPPVTCHENNQQEAQWHQMSEEQFTCDLNCNNNAPAPEEQGAGLQDMYEQTLSSVTSMVKRMKDYWSTMTIDDNPAFAFSLAVEMIKTNLMIQYSLARDIKTETPGDRTKSKIKNICRLVAEIERKLEDFTIILENKEHAFAYIKSVDERFLEIDPLYQVLGVEKDEEDNIIGKMYKRAFASVLEMMARAEELRTSRDSKDDPAFAFIIQAEIMRKYLNRQHISARDTSKYFEEGAKSRMEEMCRLVHEVEGENPKFIEDLKNMEMDKAFEYIKSVRKRSAKLTRDLLF